MRLGWAIGAGLALLQLTTAAQNTPAPTNAPINGLKDAKEKMSYAIGMDIGSSLKRGGVDLDMDLLTGALKDAVAGKEMKMTEQQAREAIGGYRQAARAKMEEERHKSAQKNKDAGAAFLAENKNKPGVKTMDVKLPDGSTAELQYKVLTEGTGPIPKSNDTVVVTYRGTLIDGKEFDSSAKHPNQPTHFQVNRVVRGWTAALEHMPVGSKWEIFLPSTLAYGDNGSGPMIEPGSTLIFDVELTSIEAPPAPPPPAAPLTSDIIRVPSAEELKHGAKIEVIKPEDLEKLTNAAAQKPEKK